MRLSKNAEFQKVLSKAEHRSASENTRSENMPLPLTTPACCTA
jgi:hypothetical protein